MSGGNATQTDATKEEPTLVESERRSALRTLYAVSGIHMLAAVMLADAKLIVYMRHFKGEAAMVAKASALGMSMMTLASIFTAPMLSALSDLYGRKVILLLAPLFSFGLRVAEAANPTARMMQTTTVLGVFGMASLQGTRTSIVDLFRGDAKGAGGALAAMRVGPLAAATLGPQIGGILAARDVRLPFLFSALLCAVESIFVLRCVPETRPQSMDSKGIQAATMNPLRFLSLFTRGPKLALLAFSQFLSDLVEPMVIQQNRSIIQTSTLGWGIRDRALFMSVGSVIAAPGYALAGSACKKLGLHLALLAGSASVIAQNIFEASVTTRWQQFMVIVVGLPRGTGTAALSSMLMEAATAAGIGQADLQGSLQSLQQVTMALGFPLWARVCGASLGAGKPRRFFLAVAAVAAAQLLISQYAAQRRDWICKGDAASA